MFCQCNVVSKVVSQRPDQLENNSAPHQEDQTAFEPDNNVQVNCKHKKVQKQLSDEAIRHISTAKVIHKPVDVGISNYSFY